VPKRITRRRTDPYGEPSIERITTAALMDILEVPMKERHTMVHRRIARIMRELHWIPVRVRDLRSIRGENVRGYMRQLRDRPHDLQHVAAKEPTTDVIANARTRLT
jgi:hypothetical protein